MKSKSVVSMPVIGDGKYKRYAACRKAEFIRWKKNAHINLKANKNTDKESLAVSYGIG